MTGYKIIYGSTGHDCWGASDFNWHGSWSDKIYANKQKCLDRIEELKKEYGNKYEFDIKCVDIDFDGYDC